MKKPLANTAASIRQRLLHGKEDFGLVLTKYGLERVLYRISKSKYRESFVLKGALLFELWTQKRYRPTRDADFLVRGENNLERFVDIFRLICEMRVEDDGLRFDADTVTAERITEDADYEGVRVKFVGYLEQARIPIQIDLGFGDVITPGTVETEIPSLLDLPQAQLQTYPRESVVAEKFEAIVNLGMANSRMKDFYYLLTLSREFPFEGKVAVGGDSEHFCSTGDTIASGNASCVHARVFRGRGQEEAMGWVLQQEPGLRCRDFVGIGL